MAETTLSRSYGRIEGAERTPTVRWAGLVGVARPPLFGAVIALATLLQYDFRRGLGWHPVDASSVPYPSALALGPYGWLQVANFVLFGLLLLVFAVGLHRGVGDGRGSKLGPALLTAAGVGLVLCGFKTEPDLSTTPQTVHGWLHLIGFFVMAGGLLGGAFALWRRLRKHALWRCYGRYSLVTGLLAIASFAVPGQASIYLLLAVMLAWVEVLAIRLLSRADQSEG